MAPVDRNVLLTLRALTSRQLPQSAPKAPKKNGGLFLLLLGSAAFHPLDPSSPQEKPVCTSGFDFSVERTRLSVLLHAPSSRSRGGQPRHVCPARAPRDHALPLRLPGAERATGVLPQLANRGVRRGVQLQRPPHHRAVRDGDDDALPNAATGCEAQAMEEHAAEDIKHIPPTTVRLLPPDLCPSASLTGAMPRSGAVLVGL